MTKHKDILTRKQQHLLLALENESQGSCDFGKDYFLPYTALPEINLVDVDTSVNLFGKKLNQPLIIASMTGGSEHSTKINTNLAMAAETMRVALGVGSQRVALEKEEARKSFELVRKFAPTTVVFANMGAVQLNYGHAIASYKRVVEMVSADALYLHLNPMQEALQPEGDTNWAGLLEKIARLVSKMPVPVWVKEVGTGLDQKTIKDLVNVGVNGIDVAGAGGTSWTWIEGQRSGNKNLTDWFANFGIPTEQALLEAVRNKGQAKVIASGGIRSPIQGLKALLMGANFYSAARPFLDPAMKSSEEVIKLLQDWEKGLKIAMFGIGKKSILSPTEKPSRLGS